MYWDITYQETKIFFKVEARTFKLTVSNRLTQLPANQHEESNDNTRLSLQFSARTGNSAKQLCDRSCRQSHV